MIFRSRWRAALAAAMLVLLLVAGAFALHLSGGGYLSQSSKTLHFGLGERDHIDRVEILWPKGTRQTLDQPKINARHDVTEP
jgi:DMSO/TMAO reductase YedYZ molybdopterin-dependent catalytic subunit